MQMVRLAGMAKTLTSGTSSSRVTSVVVRRWPALQRGFTLVELLVVLGISAILIAVVPVAFDRMREGAQYRAVVRTIASDLRAARQEALSTGADTRFVLDLERRRYGLDGQADHPLPDSLTLQATVAEIEVDGRSTAGIRFLSSGAATGGTIDVVRAGGGGTRLKVDWLTGRLTVESL